MNVKRLIAFTALLSVASFGASADSGAKLFEGSKPFKNGGVACIACHNVNSSDGYIRGENLQKI